MATPNPLHHARLRGLVRRAGHALIGAVLVAPAIGLAPSTVHATAGVSYPGGCAISNAYAEYDSCVFINLGGDQETVVFSTVANGSVTISGCGKTFVNAQSLVGLTAGCFYTVTVNRNGFATVFDPAIGTSQQVGSCTFVQNGGNTATCTYVAYSGLGFASSAALTGTPVTTLSLYITVQDLTTATTVCTSPTSFNIGIVEQLCPYSQTEGHLMAITAHFTGAAVAVIAEADEPNQ